MDKKCASAGFELDGHVYFIEYDEDDNEINRTEIDGEAVLKILSKVIMDSTKEPIDECQSESEKD